MIERLTVRTFKSLDDVRVELGLVNVFIGANGSGKSNLLEALGVLSAAADGKVDDLALLARGVRPGLPAQYKSAFPAMRGKKIPPHLHFGAGSAQALYEVSLHNPLEDPEPGGSRRNCCKRMAPIWSHAFPPRRTGPVRNEDWPR